MKKRLFFLILLLVFTIPAFAGNLLFVKPSGQDYVEVGAGDPYFDRMIQVLNRSPELQQVVLNYERTQLIKKANLVKSMKDRGESADKIKLVLKNYQIKPLVISLSSDSGGSSMGVKDFVVNKQGTGNTQKRMSFNKTPIIKVSMNGETVKSGDTADLVRSIAHETGHCIMANEYRGSFPASNHYGQAHWRNMISDGGLALAEGWAEMNGPYFSQEKTFIEPVSNGEYAFQDNKATLKSYDDMTSTEGVVASVFWDIVNKIPNGYDKCLAVFSKSRPADLNAFIEVYNQTFPTDKAAIFKIMTINTLCANISPNAQKVYSDFRSGSISKEIYIGWLNDTMKQSWQDLGNVEKIEPIFDQGQGQEQEEEHVSGVSTDTVRIVPASEAGDLNDPIIFNRRGE